MASMKYLQSIASCAVVWALCSTLAQASVGLTVLAGSPDDGPITVFYPSSSEAASVQRGVFKLNVAWQGQALRGNGRLLVLSHGSGGSPWPQSDLAQYLVGVGFVVALPEHRGDNWHDHGKEGPESWKLRPAEVSRAIDVVTRDPRFAPLVEAGRVGVYGMSAGGQTALTLAGGRWSPAQLLKHCEAHLAEDFAACTGNTSELKGNAWDSVKLNVAMPLIRWTLRGDDAWYSHTDARVAAIVAAVPMAADFDLATLAVPRVPLGLIQAEQDRWLVPKFHSAQVLAVCKPCETVARLASGGHGSLLAPLPPDLSAHDLRVLADPPGFDRAELPALYQRISDFFQRHLLP